MYNPTREQQRKEMLRKANIDLQNYKLQRKAYKETLWASDAETNRINVAKFRSTNTTSVGTDTASPEGSVPRGFQPQATAYTPAWSSASVGASSPEVARRISFASVEEEEKSEATTPTKGDVYMENEAYYNIVSLFQITPRAMEQLMADFKPVSKQLEEMDIKMGFDYNNDAIYLGDESNESEQIENVGWINTYNKIIDLAKIKKISLKTDLTIKRKADGSPVTTPSDAKKQSKTQRKGANPSEAESIIKMVLTKLPLMQFRNQINPVYKSKNIASNVYIGIRYDDKGKPGDLDFYPVDSNQPFGDQRKSNILKNIDWIETLGQLFKNMRLARDSIKENSIKGGRSLTQNQSQIVQYINEILEAFSNNNIVEVKERSPRSQYLGLYEPKQPLKQELESEINSTIGKSISGRGLRGRGRAPSYNLKFIEGTGSASDQQYRRFGSKFIRLSDLKLKEPKLKLVYPNRTQVGRVRPISIHLAKLLDELVRTPSSGLSQQKYSLLDFEEKQLLQEVLKLTHLAHEFDIVDPIEQLRMEWDKLTGQLKLGNTNPQMIQELKTLAFELHKQKLVSDKDFRQILLL